MISSSNPTLASLIVAQTSAIVSRQCASKLSNIRLVAPIRLAADALQG